MSLNLVILGPPGAGKGTQAERLARLYAIPKVSTGDILREAVQEGSDLGLKARAIMEAGKLVSDDIMIGIVQARLAQADAQSGFVLDGFPRTVAQAQALDRIIGDRDPLIVVHIQVPEEDLIRRLSERLVCSVCGATPAPTESGETCPRCQGRLVRRSDDSAAVVRERLEVDTRGARPLLDYYRSRPAFRSMDGAQPPERVTEALIDAVESTRVDRPTAVKRST